ncbi:MFS transporter [Kitasatospora camelliae]|uniref:MFS transporter n=1 Tax=Kitasatospora camelliae TaxID=3156397 RepID=A0AAU8JQW1_9ACTN
MIPSPRRSPAPLLRPSPVLRLLVGRSLAALATALIPTTLTLAVIRSGSAGDLGLVLSSELVPMLLLLPVAGVAADRLVPHRLLLTADLVRAAGQLGIAAELLFGPGRIAVLAALAAVTGTAVAFGAPAVRTLVAATVPGDQRLQLNSRIGVAQGLAQIAGPAAAGGLMLAVGAGWSSLLTAVLYAVAAASLIGLRPNRDTAPATGDRATFTTELRAGWAETRRHPWFLANVLGHGVWHLGAGVLLTLGPLIAHDRLGGDGAWVVIAQVGSIGLVAGLWAAGRLPIRRPLVGVAVGAAAYGLPLAALGFTLPTAVVTAAYCLGMIGLGVLSPLWETTLQNRIPHEALGRVGAFDSLISFASRPLGLAVAAPIASIVGTAAPLLVMAAAVTAANLAILLLPDVRTPTPTEPTPTPATTPA